MRVFDLLVSGLTPADVKSAFEADWAGNGPLLVMTGPEAVSAADLASAWRTNETAAPLATFADREIADWVYWKFGKRGKVTSRTAGPEFTRLTFKNGVVLNFKQTDYQSGGVDIRVRFGHGESGLSAADRVPASLATGMFPNGGLGKMDYEQIGSALTNSTWTFSMEARPTAFLLSSSTLSDNVDQQMRLLAAYMTDPGFRPLIDEKLPTALDLSYRMFDTDPGFVATLALERTLFPGRESLPPREKLAAYRAADFERMLKPALTRSPLEVTIVGDIAEDQAKRAVAATFGALPRRPELPALPKGKGPFRYFPERLPPPVTETHRGPADKAAAVLAWPLYVANPERRREEYSLHLLRSVLETRLLRQVRVVMGKVYSPSVGLATPDDADQGILTVTLEAAPEEIQALVEAAQGVAGDLAKGAISQEELDAARTPMLAAADQALRENASWASIIALSGANRAGLRELTGFRADLEALTLDDVRRAAATWLSPTPMVSRSLPAHR
jgi:zinc protease